MGWQVIDLDVWGNAKDGFDINNFFDTDTFIELTALFTDEELILALKRAGIIKRNVRYTSVHVDTSAEGYICVEDARNGQPCVHLKFVEGE